MSDPTPRDDRDLHHVLRDAVADVEPAPALDAIRTRAKDTHMSDARPWIYGFVGAAAATAAVVVGVAVLGDSDPVSTSDPASSPSSEAEPTEAVPPTESAEPTEAAPPSESPAPEPTESSPGVGGEEATVPVYYLGDTPAGPALYREFLRTKTPDGPVPAAVTAALDTSPSDPDYRSPWADLPFDVDESGSGSGPNGLTVALSADAPWQQRPSGMNGDEAAMAVAQLVWTATAAAQEDTAVRFEVNGSATDRLLGVSVAGGASRADAMQTLAPVWVTSPQDGQTVAGTFTVEGQGAFFEANVSWQLLDASGEVVRDGFATARECCTLSPYTFQVKGVAPGDYTLRVYSADESGGEGPGEPEDTKRLTVR
jgi:hypothetical protein